MSLVPMMFDDFLERRRQLLNGLWDPTNLGLSMDDFWLPRRSLLSWPRMCPMRGSADSRISTVHIGKDGFKVNLDVQQFKPEELKVRVVDDYLVVEAKHEERSDEHGFISRQFTRRYKLPDDVDPQALVSKLSSDGVLSLEAPKKSSSESGNIREIPITHTNAPAIKENEHEIKTELKN